MPASHDSVDRLLAQWRTTDPELDVRTVAVVTRLGRVRAHMDASMNAVFAHHGLTAGDFAALSILRRAGVAGATMSDLADGLALTGGTVTTRVHRIVNAGWAQAVEGAADRRVRRVSLTPAGQAVFDRAVPDHLANQQAMLAPLTAGQQAQLTDLLRILLASFEHPSRGADGNHPSR
jgi:DNA-binding MarR family transcriptional regulator